MRILIALDSFKDAANARSACQALADGIHAVQRAGITICPLADGGEGTLDMIEGSIGGERIEIPVVDPLFRKTVADLFVDRHGNAFVEMALASGLERLAPQERNCRWTTSLGAGQLVLAALERNVKKVILTLGGSATNDGGIGIAHALGVRFRDNGGEVLKPIGENLGKIRAIDTRSQNQSSRTIPMEVWCDVQNPFIGPNGATMTYARQKGATWYEIEKLEAGMVNFHGCLVEKFGIDVGALPGAGAAGGIGGGMAAIFSAKLKKGINQLLEIVDFDTHCKQADLVITGEGRFDLQTIQGKVFSGVRSSTRKFQKPLLVVCGENTLEGTEMEQYGISAVYEVSALFDNTSTSIQKTLDGLFQIGEKIGRTL